MLFFTLTHTKSCISISSPFLGESIVFLSCLPIHWSICLSHKFLDISLYMQLLLHFKWKFLATLHAPLIWQYEDSHFFTAVCMDQFWRSHILFYLEYFFKLFFLPTTPSTFYVGIPKKYVYLLTTIQRFTYHYQRFTYHYGY